MSRGKGTLRRAVRVLVTGGAGFIGSHVVDLLVKRGHDVIVLDALDPAVHGSEPGYLNADAEYARADITDAEAVERLLAGVDAVSHHAAMVGLGRGVDDAERYVRTNDLGTATLLRLARARHIRRLVLASSMVVYGEGAYDCPTHGPQHPAPRAEAELAAGRFDPPCVICGSPLEARPIAEGAALEPRSVYAATKVHQEHLAFVAMREGGPAVTALRYHNVYGPRMPRNTPYAGVASLMRSHIARGEAPRVFEDGRQTRDFVHVRDVALANMLALERDEAATGVYNIGSGEPRTILDLARALTAALGGPEPIVTGEFRLADVRHIFASSAKAARELGYRTRGTFTEGIVELADGPLREAVV